MVAVPSAPEKKVEQHEWRYWDAPTLWRFAHCNAFYRGLMGPFGSGKSTACCWEIYRRALAQAPGPDGVRRTRCAVVRNTEKELEDTTLKTFKTWLIPGLFGSWHQSRLTFMLRIGTPDGRLAAECEVIFRALDVPKQVRDLLSLELTFAWANEARELEFDIWNALGGRVNRWPPMKDGGATWAGVWADTNPPDDLSWWYTFFEETGIGDADIEVFKQPSALGPDAENRANLPPDYYQKLMVGKSAQFIRVYVHGEYGTVEEGKPIYEGQWNDRLHVATEELWPMKNVPIALGFDFGNCYDDQTEVLTEAGWKLFKDVNEKLDRVASRSPETGAMEYTDINFKVDEPYVGEMLHWSGKSVDFCVTPEHRVPMTFRETPNKVHFKEARWLADHPGGHHFVDLLSEWAPEPDAGTYFGMDATTYARFMGMYLSEGSIGQGYDKRITIYQKCHIPKWERALEATGLNWTWVKYGATSGWRANAPMMVKMLRKLGKAHEKRVPREILAMDKGPLLAFIQAYTEGDGHIRVREGSEEHTIFTVSETMAGDLQEIAQKVGWCARVSWRKGQQSVIREANGPRTITNNGGWCITFKKKASRAELLHKNLRRVQYSGRIYCLNVPHHTLYVRRNGKAHWNGNTPACVIAQLTPRGQLRVLEEVVGDQMGIRQLLQALKPILASKYKDCPIEHSVTDVPKRAETDFVNPLQIMHEEGIPGTVTPNNSPKVRFEWVRHWLMGLRDGHPTFLLSPTCKYLRRGFNGGYKLRRLQVSGPEKRFTEAPDKNRWSHPHEALQYLCSAFAPENISKPPPPPQIHFEPVDTVTGV